MDAHERTAGSQGSPVTDDNVVTMSEDADVLRLVLHLHAGIHELRKPRYRRAPAHADFYGDWNAVLLCIAANSYANLVAALDPETAAHAVETVSAIRQRVLQNLIENDKALAREALAGKARTYRRARLPKRVLEDGIPAYFEDAVYGIVTQSLLI